MNKKLSDLFGFTITTGEPEGALAVKALAEEFDLSFDPESGTAGFSGEAETYTIRHDVNDRERPVYQGVYTTYCPTVHKYTEYVDTPEQALKDLAAMHKAEIEALRNRRKR